MKKLIALLLVALSVLSVSASGFLDDFRDGKNYVPDHVYLFTGNDLFSYGVTRNDDDQLSYSFDFQVEAPIWYTRVNLNGITNRGWRDGWDMRNYYKKFDDGADVNKGRYDSLEGVVGLKLRPIEDRFYLHIYPEVGLTLLGDYGWVWAQNMIHKIGGIHCVELPYDNPGQKTARMILGTRVNAGFKLFRFERSNQIVELEASTKNILGFQSENYVMARASISTETHDLVGFHFGYMFASALTDTPSYTQDLYLRYLRGWRLGFTVDTGLIFLKYTGNLESHYGYGYIGVDAMGFFAPRSWEETDAYLRFTKSSFYGHFYNLLSVGIPISDHLEVMIKNSYLGGEPLSPKEEAEADLDKEVRLKQDYSFFTLGVRINAHGFLSDYVNPYLEVALGLQRFVVYILNNQVVDPDDMIGGYVPSAELLSNDKGSFDKIFGLVSIEAGIDILPESLVVFQDTSMQLEVFGGVNVICGGTTQEISIYRYINKFWETLNPEYLDDLGWKARFVPYYGFGVKFGFDL